LQIYKTRWFVKYAKRERISDRSLFEAIDRAERGLVDADLGGGLIKQRVARPGQGRSSGYRVLIAYRTSERAFFVFGFAKNVLDNLDAAQLLTWRNVASDLLAAAPEQLAEALSDSALKEINYDPKT